MDICCGKIKNIEGRDENIIEIIQTDGDQDLGGKHFDEIIKELFMRKLDEIDSSLTQNEIIVMGDED